MVDGLECRYMLYGKEVGASGTPHLQGFVVFKTSRRIGAVIKKMPGCHVEVCRDVMAAMEYCKKDGDWTERGEKPRTRKEVGEGNKRRWQEAMDAAKDGDYDKIPADLFTRYQGSYKKMRMERLAREVIPDTDATHEWYYGPTGTGKSRKAREENPEAYLKMCNKWWCGYDPDYHKVVLIEDFDKRHDVLAHHMKIWGDRYAFMAEMKGAGAQIRPEKIIVTSNYHPSDIWMDDADLKPILRRFKCIHFPSATPFTK